MESSYDISLASPEFDKPRIEIKNTMTVSKNEKWNVAYSIAT
jgi:hypothetical protein